MTLKVAYLECTGDLWTETAEIMKREQGWEPVYWSGALRMGQDVESRFPGAVFHENTLAAKGRWPAKASHLSGRPLDETLLATLSYVETMALHMMDRMDPDSSFSFTDRVAAYHNHLRFALAVLDTLQPELCILACPPHLVYDYVLYELCRVRRVPVVVFIETAADGLIYGASGYEEAPRILGDVYRKLLADGAPANLSSRGRAYVARLKGDYQNAVPEYIVDMHAYQQVGRGPAASEVDISARIKRFTGRLVRSAKAKQAREIHPSNRTEVAQLRNAIVALPGFSRLKTMLAETGRSNDDALRDAVELTRYIYEAIETQYPLHLRISQAEPTYLKQYAITMEDSELSYLEYWLYRSLALRKKRALLAQHQKTITPADLSQPFIYVPLQYQPEVSTSPLAGVYVEQYLLVEMLARVAPTGWLVYVKENKFTFDKKGAGEVSRSFDFYRKLTALPNVRLVPLETPQFELIDRAKAVATATGTSGWEALFRGTPVLTFGYAWYRECDGALQAADLDECRAAIQRIADGYRPDEAKVLTFLQAIETISFRGYTIPELSSAANITPEQNVRSFVKSLKQAVPIRNGDHGGQTPNVNSFPRDLARTVETPE